MANNEDGSSSQYPPHIESSDSEQSVFDSDDESSGSSDSEDGNLSSEQTEDITGSNIVEESANKSEKPEATIFVAPDGREIWTPKCEDKYKPYPNKHFPTLDDAFLFYQEYGRKCGFDVRKSTVKSDRRGNVLSRYIQCSNGGYPMQKKMKLAEDFVADGSQTLRRTTSKRCNCKAHIILKNAGPRGFVVMSFVEDHNDPLASADDRIFLRCNRAVSIVHQNFIM